MSDNIKLPTLPKPDTHCFDEDHATDVWSYSQAQMQDYAREAVRLNAQAVPDRMALVDRGLLTIVINALRRDAEEGKQVRGEMADLLSEAPAAPQPAQQPLTDEHKAILKKCRDQAMRWTLRARIAEAGVFGGIAQDLEYLCGQLGARHD